MALTGSPTFLNKEILTFQKLNNWADTISTKFDSNIQAADISWPLVAQGNLDMNGNSIVGVSSLFNIYVVVTGFTFAQAVAAVNTDGGGVIYIPTGTTVTLEDVDITTGDVMIVGGGPDSILQIGGAVTDYGLSFASSSHNILIADLTIDGNSQTAHGIQFAPSQNIQVRNVLGKSFGSGHGVLSFQGSGDTVCERVKISSCDFSANYISLDFDGIDMLQIVGCNFDGGKGDDIYYSDATASRPFRDVSIVGCAFVNADANCIELINGAAAGVTRTNLTISGCNFRGDSSGAATIELTKFRNFTITGSAFYLPGAEAILLTDCDYGSIVGNTITGPGQSGDHGINVDSDCTYMTVQGNNVSAMTGGTAAGIYSAGDYCAVSGNICSGNVYGIVVASTLTVSVGNGGQGNSTAQFSLIAGSEAAHNHGDE